MNPSLPATGELLEALTSGAFLVGTDGRTVEAANPVLRQWLDLSLEAPVPPVETWLNLPPKSDCPFCQGLGGLPAPACHAALLANQTRVKVKHSVLPDGRVFTLVDSFAEDVTLTQAHADFVSTVSHEFRTPLTSIKGFADTMLRYGGQLPAEQQKRFVSIIKDQADRLTRLVENLLSASRLGAGRLEYSYRPVALAKLVEKVIQSLRGKGEATERRFTVNLPATLPEVWADADKLEQILLNLVDNAVKYSFPQTEIRIDARLLPEGEHVQIDIADQGVGIPAEYLPKIFSQFSRIDNPLTRQVEGTGLGLYITQALTVALGGEITVTSQPGVGTTFTLRFPIATAERQAIHRRKQWGDSTPMGPAVVETGGDDGA